MGARVGTEYGGYGGVGFDFHFSSPFAEGFVSVKYDEVVADTWQTNKAEEEMQRIQRRENIGEE